MTRRIVVIDAKGAVHGHSIDLPAMQPGDSVRVTMTDDGTFDVVPLVMVSGPPVILWGRAYSDGSGPVVFEHDAPEQGNDRG